MPGFAPENFFSHTLTYICEHSKNGGMGLVINRTFDLTVGEIFRQMNIDPGELEIIHHQALLGGPVDQARGFVLHSPDALWDNSLQTGDGVSITSSRKVLEALARGKGPKEAIVVLGYAGWTAGQLEHELQQNLWLTCPASADIIFHVAVKRGAMQRRHPLVLTLPSSRAWQVTPKLS